jgi:mannose-1-phosphate guanylyltransferase/mannose-6-phosphate isomerase
MEVFSEEKPWGGFDVIYENEGIKVKILMVSPGKRLSYQSHAHRSERWIVVMGKAEIMIDDEMIIKNKGETVSIEQGQKHRLSNPGKETLKIVEVQLGDYLGEDDIIRYEDDFGRR